MRRWLDVFLLGIGLTVWSGASSVMAEDRVGEVTHVRGGDTLEMAGVAVRLFGITAPELDTVAGEAVRRFMMKIILNRQVRCRLNGKNSYGRLVGRCFYKGQDLGILLVSAGHTADCPRYSNGYFKPFETENVKAWRKPIYY